MRIWTEYFYDLDIMCGSVGGNNSTLKEVLSFVNFVRPGGWCDI